MTNMSDCTYLRVTKSIDSIENILLKITYIERSKVSQDLLATEYTYTRQCVDQMFKQNAGRTGKHFLNPVIKVA